MEKRVIAIFPQGGNFSGQTSAAWHVMRALTHHGWCVESLTTPVFSRTGNRWHSLADYGREIRRLCGSVVSTLHGRPLFYLNMGQSWVALLRDGLTYILASGCGWRGPGILSLHGNWFMSWSRFELKALWLVLIGALCERVTVLGPGQRAVLLGFGFSPDKVVVVDNTCDIEPLDPDAVSRKQHEVELPMVLYLSNLIDTKGYREFLGALGALQGRGLTNFRATLCGSIVLVGYREGSETAEQAATAVEATIAALRSQGVEISWVRGAEGRAKQDLYHEAHVFVFPSRVEAQPLCLIEAMASGCAIITSQAGEIVDSVGEEAGVLLEKPDVGAVADALESILCFPETRRAYAINARQRFEKRFAMSVHASRWHDLCLSALRRRHAPVM